MNDKKKKTIVQIQLEAWKLDWNSILTFTGKNELTSKKIISIVETESIENMHHKHVYCT